MDIRKRAGQRFQIAIKVLRECTEQLMVQLAKQTAERYQMVQPEKQFDKMESDYFDEAKM